MPRYAYITTTAPCSPLGGRSEVSPPTEPEGDGWEFLGTSANEHLRFFEWRRALAEAKKK